MFFRRKRDSTYMEWREVIHTGNIESYTLPTKTMQQRRDRLGNGGPTFDQLAYSPAEYGFAYGDSGSGIHGPFIHFGGLNGGIGNYACQITAAYNGGGHTIKFRTHNGDANVWNDWRTLVTDANVGSYAPGLTGAGASGTWNINIAGNVSGNATGAWQLNGDASVKSDSLQYWNSNGDSVLNPNGDWHYALRMSHGNAESYYSATLAMSFHADTLQFRRKTNGSYQSWRTVLHDDNYNSYAPSLTGTGASGTWSINITGSAGAAAKLTAVRSITLTGDVSGTVFFDGSADVSMTTTGSLGLVRAADNKLPLTHGGLVSSSLTTATTAADQVVDSFATTAYRTAEYLVQATSGAFYHSTKILLLHDGTNVWITEYGEVWTSARLLTLSASISGGNLSLLATPTNAATTIRSIRTAITV